MEIFPLDDRVLVEPIEEEEKVGTLLIPDTAKDKPMTGIVRAIGNDYDIIAGRPLLHELVKAGDKVLFGKYNGQEFRTGGKKFLVITRCDLLAVMR
jgi:chaperonin GroES